MPSKKEITHHVQKLRQIYAQTKVKGTYIDYEIPYTEIVKKAKEDDVFYKYSNKEDVYFCCYKTKFEDQDAVMFLFTMVLPGPASGSTLASELVMDFIGMMEKKFYPIKFSRFHKETDMNNKNIGFLKFIKLCEKDI